MRAVQQRHCELSPSIMTMSSSPQVTLSSSIWKRRSPCSSACCPAEALRVVTIDHDDVIIATGDGAACAAGAELDLEAKEPMQQCVLSSRGTVGVASDHDIVVIATGDVAACAAGAELDLEAAEPM